MNPFALIVLASALSGQPQFVQDYCAKGCVVMSEADWEALKQHIARLKAEAERANDNWNKRAMCT